MQGLYGYMQRFSRADVIAATGSPEMMFYVLTFHLGVLDTGRVHIRLSEVLVKHSVEPCNLYLGYISPSGQFNPTQACDDALRQALDWLNTCPTRAVVLYSQTKLH